LKCYASQVVGVTGTKGKSTTVSLITHFLKAVGKKTLLIGNIGVPAFDMIDAIEKDTIIVYELSAHQLEYLHRSPHIAVLLNVFPEHLDYFYSYNNYCKAKFNIYKFQNKEDCLIANESLISKIPDRKHRFIEVSHDTYDLKIKKSPLMGDHNIININAALLAANEVGVSINDAINSLDSFMSLPHRLENIGEFRGITFINDSISTVPESTIAAVKAFGNIDTLILGGYDRRLDYSQLIEFLETSNIRNFIFLGMAGDRMFDIFGTDTTKRLFKANSIESAFKIIVQNTAKGSICLLSPAAASYDQFHNFEHRGDTFKALAVRL
jgi:UDP-N-acetylmuramoylalanine--D-glutamate ligase